MLLHPMILLGCAYTLKHLRSRGFETFPEMFDESYDDIENNNVRLLAAVDEGGYFPRWDNRRGHRATLPPTRL